MVMLIAVWEIPNLASAQTTIVSIEPSQVNLPTPSTFTLNITVANVTDLSAWQIKLAFDPSTLNCIEISVPEQNIFYGHDTIGILTKIDNLNGYITAFNGLWEPKGVNGSGALCQITFNASNVGITSIRFVDAMNLNGTYLVDSTNTVIPFQTQNSYIEILNQGFTKYTFDAIKNGQSYTVSIITNSTITQYNFNETLKEMSFKADGTATTIGLCSTSIPKQLLNGTFVVLINGQPTYYATFTDETNSYINFNYTHAETSLNIRILETLQGDLNGDRKVDIKDVSIAAKAFGTMPGDSRWNPIADLNKDLKIDLKDIAIVAKNFGKTYQ